MSNDFKTTEETLREAYDKLKQELKDIDARKSVIKREVAGLAKSLDIKVPKKKSGKSKSAKSEKTDGSTEVPVADDTSN
jgi:hypothetical protein